MREMGNETFEGQRPISGGFVSPTEDFAFYSEISGSHQRAFSRGEM